MDELSGVTAAALCKPSRLQALGKPASIEEMLLVHLWDQYTSQGFVAHTHKRSRRRSAPADRAGYTARWSHRSRASSSGASRIRLGTIGRGIGQLEDFLRFTILSS